MTTDGIKGPCPSLLSSIVKHPGQQLLQIMDTGWAVCAPAKATTSILLLKEMGSLRTDWRWRTQERWFSTQLVETFGRSSMLSLPGHTKVCFLNRWDKPSNSLIITAKLQSAALDGWLSLPCIWNVINSWNNKNPPVLSIAWTEHPAQPLFFSVDHLNLKLQTLTSDGGCKETEILITRRAEVRECCC